MHTNTYPPHCKLWLWREKLQLTTPLLAAPCADCLREEQICPFPARSILDIDQCNRVQIEELDLAKNGHNLSQNSRIRVCIGFLVSCWGSFVLLDDVFWIVKGFHVTWLWISQADLPDWHNANQVWDQEQSGEGAELPPAAAMDPGQFT